MTVVLEAAGVAAATAKTISAVFSAVTTAASLASAVATPIVQARNESALAEAQAAFQDQEAKDRAVSAGVAAERHRKRVRAQQAENEAGAAEAGVLGGSSLDLLDANSVAFELDALTIEYNGRNDAKALSDSAALRRADAGNIRAGGTIGAVGTGVGRAPGFINAIDGLNF